VEGQDPGLHLRMHGVMSSGSQRDDLPAEDLVQGGFAGISEGYRIRDHTYCF
jgi:hypothetical protein